MTVFTRWHARPWLVLVALLGMLILLSGAAHAQPDRIPPGHLARHVQVTGRIAMLPAINADSIEVSGTWSLPSGGGGQWGPVQSLLVCALGGAMPASTVLGPGNSTSACRTLGAVTAASSIRLPFDLSIMGDLTGSVWKVRLCVTTRRHQQDGPQACADHTFPLDAPAPDPVTNLQVTSRVIRAGNE